jgi:hypothetical protein
MGCGLYSSGSRQNLIVKSCEYGNELSAQNQGCIHCLDKRVLLGVSYLVGHNKTPTLSQNVTTWKWKLDVKIILKWEMNVGYLWIVIGVDKIRTMLNIRIPVQKLVIRRPVGKHVLPMKATSYHHHELRLDSHCRNVKAGIYPCERIQKRRITRLSNLF